jgi:NAD(P)-dependent dehydrogenase (short-subunit alcohol dehydrogenase family)
MSKQSDNDPAIPAHSPSLAESYDFTGQTVVVTGGTGVLGGAMACALAACGANVAILGRNLEAGQAILSRMGDSASHAALISCDILDHDSIEKAAAEITSRFKAVDHLINAAGGNNPKATSNHENKFFNLPAEALRYVFDLNLTGTVLPSQVFGKIMADRGQGNILNITSMAGDRPLTRVGAYSAAKAGISNFTKWLAVHMAQEYSPRIRVNAISPGFFLTTQNRFLLTDKETGKLTARGQSIIAHTPMGRFGDPNDLLGAMFWLLSPTSSFVTGAVIPVDGGFSAFSGV